MTVTRLAKELGVCRATLYRIKRQYPAQAPKTDDLEKWRSFLLAHVIDPDVVTRLCR
jgi:hypothetical protein